MSLALWYLVLITYVACNDPVVRSVQATPFETQEACEAHYSKLPPPVPGSHYDCRRYVSVK